MNLPWNRRTQKRSKQPSVKQLDDAIAKLNYHSLSADLGGKLFFYRLRNIWGVGLGVVLALSIFFEYLLTIMVGTGVWNFEKYQAFLNIIAGQMFIQIIGLCAIVVKALFTPITVEQLKNRSKK